jgi:hypothetical protein
MAMMAQTTAPVDFSQTWTFFEGSWHEGNVPIMGARTHAAWLGSTVFDGARAFEGVAPDLDRHTAPGSISPPINFKLKPVVDAETWLGLAREGMARFDANAELGVPETHVNSVSRVLRPAGLISTAGASVCRQESPQPGRQPGSREAPFAHELAPSKLRPREVFAVS